MLPFPLPSPIKVLLSHWQRSLARAKSDLLNESRSFVRRLLASSFFSASSFGGAWGVELRIAFLWLS